MVKRLILFATALPVEGSPVAGEMGGYMVETYIGRRRAGGPAAISARAGEAARLLASEGRKIRFLRATYVPEDEVCFLLYDAESAAVVAEAVERAAIKYERILQTLDESPGA